MTRPSSAMMAINLGEMRYPTISCFLMAHLSFYPHELIRRSPDAIAPRRVLYEDWASEQCEFSTQPNCLRSDTNIRKTTEVNITHEIFILARNFSRSIALPTCSRTAKRAHRIPGATRGESVRCRGCAAES